jgi:large subunit ribosomal protein L9
VKVIFLEDVRGVGKKGQLLDVSDGHARNYLLPKKLAVEATKSNLNELAAKERAAETKNKRELEKALKIAESFKDKVLVISVKSGEKGKLYGSVTNKEIAAAILEQIGVNIDKKKITLSETIKSTGEKQAFVKVHSEVTVEITIDVRGVES